MDWWDGKRREAVQKWEGESQWTSGRVDWWAGRDKRRPCKSAKVQKCKGGCGLRPRGIRGPKFQRGCRGGRE